MKFIRSFILLMLLVISAGAQVTIPNILKWNRSFIGVPGGIPNRTTIFCTADVSIPGTNRVMVADGLAGTPTDNTIALQTAINLCPSNQVIFIDSGDYAFSNSVNLTKHNITIRGSGTNTVLRPRIASSGVFFAVGTYDVQIGYFPISAGFTNSSTNIYSSSIPGSVIPNGATLQLSQSNDYFYVHSLINSNGTSVTIADTTLTNHQRLDVWVTAVSGNQITFWPPLPFDLTNGPVSANGFSSASRMAISDGFENLRIFSDDSNNVPSFNIDMDEAFGCWIKNIESDHTSQSHIYLSSTMCCEVRDNYVHDFYGGGGGNNGEGIELYSHNSGFLVENNIVVHCFPQINTSGNSSGGVVDYNFCYDSKSGSTVIGNDFDANHGMHNVMNLWEGNVGSKFQSDGFFGSASHITLYRNFFDAGNPSGLTSFRGGIDLTHWSWYFNVVGCVIGGTGINQWTNPTPPLLTGVYSSTNNNLNYLVPTIFRFGFPNIGNTGYTSASTNPPSANLNDLDYGVQPSTFLLENYDYFNKSIDVVTNGLPPSLFYTNVPSWWPATNVVPWPPIGPDVSGMTNAIPAQLRFSGQLPGGITTNLNLSSSIPSSQSGQSITLTGTFQTNSVTATDNTGTTATFYDTGPTPIGTGNISSGVATLSISTLTAGPHTLTVAFPAVAGYLATTSSIVNQVVTSSPPSNTQGIMIGVFKGTITIH
jgi:hypothetical protein